MKWSHILLCFFLFSYCSSEKSGNEDIAAFADSALPKSASPIFPATTENTETHYPNGRLRIKGILKNGKREGQWISWYETGQEWSECVYRDGLKNGPTSSWHENGMKRYEGFYTNDIKTGKWSYWDETGKLIKETDYTKSNKPEN